MAKIAKEIFQKYDIRGIYNKNLNDQDAFHIARAFAKIIKDKGLKTVSVARDGRLSSPALRDAVVKGLSTSGIDVFDLGIGPSPMLYYSVYEQNYDAGIMITASHNPKEYNGLKILMGQNDFNGDGFLKLQKIIEDENYIEGNGKIECIDIKKEYVNRLIKDLSLKNNNLKIAWDCGNAVVGSVIDLLIKKIPGEHHILYKELDGNFPNHHPDPSKKDNLHDLRDFVIDNNFDAGIAFDGDGDRIGIIDEHGNMIFGDMLLALYAEEMAKNNDNVHVITEIKASQSAVEKIENAGGNVTIWKTGHSYIKDKMKETKALLAGELSGHMFFSDMFYGFDDAVYAAVRFLNIISGFDKKLYEWRGEFRKMYNTPELRVECSEKEDKEQIISHVLDYLKEDGKNFLDIDGARVNSDDGWWLLRASGTQDLLSMRVEAFTEEKLEELKKELLYYLEKSGFDITKIVF